MLQALDPAVIAADDSETLSENVFRRIQAAIVKGEIAPGSKISEPELARTYGISRGPLREAIHRLEGQRLLVRIPHVGARVVSLSHAELIELYEIRESLEGMACRLAAERMSDEDIAELRRVLETHERDEAFQAGVGYYQQEGDFNRKGSSAYSGRMGEMVASKLCTIVDDGTLAGRRGSLSIDDEGTPTECTTLIENGVLKGYMQDKLNARLMGVARTGNGRRESYAHLPMPRMTNTYMLGGESDPAEIIASVKRGIYCANLGGGQVDITSGKFVFSTSEAYLIEDGKITAPVKGATLIGNGPEAMSKVSMVGNDLSLDSGVGTCGKDGQSVPVGVGQPTLKIDAITVGGTGS